MSRARNLIFILTDNHARSMAGCYGHPLVKTPTLDWLAAHGARFRNAYCASPLCCPSRAALATGRFPHQSGYWDNALAYDGRLPTWHHRLRASDCEVSSIGKLHYVSSENDNGFVDELLPMHIVEGRGALIGLLRATEHGVPPRTGPRQMYGRPRVGEADYQRYDRDITAAAVDWLARRAREASGPFALLLSYASPHPPFSVPARLSERYGPEDVPMPVQWRANERPTHPAIEHVRAHDGFEQPLSEDYVRNALAGYCALVNLVDEQIGQIMDCVRSSGLLESTRIVYTSDHGEAGGNHGLFAKSTLYEHSSGVPLLMMGPDISPGTVIEPAVSHVDLFPTILESMGVEPDEADRDLPGRSLWPLLDGETHSQPVFAEVHVQSTRNGAFMLRDGALKLIYHVDAPSQLFDLANDPLETRDLAGEPAWQARLEALQSQLRERLDPESVDARCKQAQRAHVDRMGGIEQILERGSITYTPVPGDPLNLEKMVR
ncbi:MAG: sulfatase-like hydrolase/transferase [Gammaproteobacteria bacterium]|nr:sulfatase-like hydrolase/transferase [Gammaproteobacteria bacterium]